MSLASVIVSFGSRIDDAREVLALLRSQEAARAPGVPVATPEYRILAGTCFVLLYAALEHGITLAVQDVLRTVNGVSVEACDINGPFYCVVLDAEFASAATVKSKRKWPSRLKLLGRQEERSAVAVNDALFNLDLQTTGLETMQLILDALGISDPVVPDNSLRGYIEEIKDKRNLVAHGREKVSAVGAGFTADDLSKRFDAINRVVTHFVDVLDAWLKAKGFAKAPVRANY